MSETPAPRGVLRPPPVVAGVAFAKLAILLTCATAYGYDKDELYSLACAQHFAWGFVERPPLSIGVLLTAAKIYGETLLSVRMLPAVSGAVVIVMTARLARRFGAGTLGQGLAALSVLVAPALLTLDHTFSMRGFEVLWWTLIAGMLARALTTPQETFLRAWVAAGLVIGLGIMNTWTTLVLVVGLALGFVVTPARAQLKTRGPWIALGVAAVCMAPNLAWERAHAWTSIHYASHALHEAALTASPLRFTLTQLVKMQPTNSIVWIAGLVGLFRLKSLAPYRLFGVAFLFAFAVFAVRAPGDSTCLAPAYPVLFAAGAATLDGWLTARRHAYAVLALALFVPGAVTVPFAIPILSVAKFEAYSRALHVTPKLADNADRPPLPEHFADMFGWPELVRTTSTVTASLSALDRDEAVVLANGTARAAAMDVFGDAVALPPVISGQGTYWLWGPGAASGNVVVAVGGDEAFLRAHFRTVALVTVFGHSLASPSERHVRIYLCRDPVAPLAEMWPDFRTLD